ncbi:MAG: aldo/keto reductase [Candidatus Sericytochromatia bacterium]
MKYRVLGRTGLKVSEIGFGGWAIGGNKYGNSYGSTDDNESLKAVLKSIDLGCNFFDTADLYGRGKSEEILGQAINQIKREDVIIADKVGADFYGGMTKMNFKPDYIKFALENSLKRLNTDYLDIYQLHNPTLEQIKDGSIFETMQELKEKGYIRAIGLCIDDAEEGTEALKFNIVDTIQVVYNIFEQAPDDELFPFTSNYNIGIIAREPLSNGLLTGLYNENSFFPAGDFRHTWPVSYIRSRTQAAANLKVLLNDKTDTLIKLALKFVLMNKNIGTVIPGCKYENHAIENMSVSDLPLLSDEELNKIDDFYFKRFGV